MTRSVTDCLFARMMLLPLTLWIQRWDMHKAICSIALVLSVWYSPAAVSQNRPKTLVAVWAHPDDEVPVGPVLARYAREGVQVF